MHQVTHGLCRCKEGSEKRRGISKGRGASKEGGTLDKRPKLWIVGICLTAIGLAGVLAIGSLQTRENPAPASSSLGFWIWVVSPSLGWALAIAFVRRHRTRSLILSCGAAIAALGGIAILYFDSNRSQIPGGMNPVSSNSIVITMIVVALLQWLLLLVLALACLGMAFAKRARATELR